MVLAYSKRKQGNYTTISLFLHRDKNSRDRIKIYRHFLFRHRIFASSHRTSNQRVYDERRRFWSQSQPRTSFPENISAVVSLTSVQVLIKQIKAAQKRQPNGSNGLKRTVTEIKPVSNAVRIPLWHFEVTRVTLIPIWPDTQDAIKNSTVKAHLERVYKQITSNAQPFLDAVLKSLTSLPYGLRLICKQLRTALVVRSYPA